MAPESWDVLDFGGQSELIARSSQIVEDGLADLGKDDPILKLGRFCD